jgi:3'(2'), 5'-bisphosphate nucleotidase
MLYERELKVALDAAELAAKLIMKDYADFKVIPDAPAEISTQTDRRSQESIIQHLREAFPNDAFCAEETSELLADLPRTGDRLWIIDPIDGTRGFARKNGEFSVMIGFVDGGKIGVGVVSEPAKNLLTYAARDSGCWRRDGNSSRPAMCRVNATATLQACTVTQSHSKDKTRPSREIAALAPAKIIETYSAGIKLAQVARGDADIYLNTYDASHDWDICAGQILVDEAGGRVSNFLGVAPRYGLPGSKLTGGLLASNGLLHDAALAALQSCRK